MVRQCDMSVHSAHFLQTLVKNVTFTLSVASITQGYEWLRRKESWQSQLNKPQSSMMRRPTASRWRLRMSSLSLKRNMLNGWKPMRDSANKSPSRYELYPSQVPAGNWCHKTVRLRRRRLERFFVGILPMRHSMTRNSSRMFRCFGLFIRCWFINQK